MSFLTFFGGGRGWRGQAHSLAQDPLQASLEVVTLNPCPFLGTHISLRPLLLPLPFLKMLVITLGPPG